MSDLAVIVPWTRPQFHDRILEMFEAQHACDDAVLVFVANNEATMAWPQDVFQAMYLNCPKPSKSAVLNFAIAELSKDFDYCCVWDDDDIYGPGYLDEVLRCKGYGVTGLSSFTYRAADGAVRVVSDVGFQGGTLAFPTDGLPPFDETIAFAEEIVWRQELEATGIKIYARLPGDYTYCRYADTEHRHTFPADPKF